ncbi:MAG TPA: ABC transporter permease [Terriglobales bacterium]|nr:ABC transporter permease [Terriglobales bacterium]
METIWQDIRYGIRNLLKTRGLTIVAVVTLALGIGANTAIFSIVDAVLLRPLPFGDPGQLVRLYETEPAPGHYPLTGPDFLDWKTQAKSFQDMSLYSTYPNLNLSDGGTPEHVNVTHTESNFFSLLQARPMLGRTWVTGEDAPGADHLIILSYGLWKTHFAGDDAVLNRQVKLNNETYTIVGVMPADFRYPSVRTQLWVPLDMDSKSLRPRGTHWAQGIGRLKPGATVQQAQTELSVIASRLEQQYPNSNRKNGAYVAPLQEDMVHGSRDGLIMMLWAVGLVLLIACANVANLLLSRAVARQKEMAIRSALGAARSRLVRQLLTESMLLAIVGAAFGILLASEGIKLLVAMKNLQLPATNSVQVNLPVLGFTLGLATLAGVLFGIFPALQTSRPHLHDELRGGAGSSSSPSRGRRVTSNALVVTEVGLSVLLLISAGLLLKDFVRLRSGSIGVRAENVWRGAVELPESSFNAPFQAGDEKQESHGATTEGQQFTFARALLERVSKLPGVESAAVTDHMPLQGGSNGTFQPRGKPSSFGEDVLTEYHNVLPGYFHALGIPILAGRDFNEQDVTDSITMRRREQGLFSDQAFAHRADRLAAKGPLSAEQTNAIVYPSVVNQTLAKFFWPDQDPVGKMYGQGDKGPWRVVIGVVGDVKEWDVTSKVIPEGYTVFTGEPEFNIVAHTNIPPESLTPAVRRVLGEMDSSLPLFAVRSMQDLINESIAGEQFLTTLLGIFAGLALLLAAVGIYGVLSYVVTQRTREIGIRMSLGATRQHVIALVLGQGSRLVILGFALGIAGAFAARRVLANSLHAVGASDPLVYIAAPACLALIALLACYVPAVRASRVDPIQALRQE